MISSMDEIDMDSDCTLSPEMYLPNGSTDIDAEQSRHVDQMNSIAWNDDDDVKMICVKTESSTLDYNDLLKGSRLDLILCPTDDICINERPCCHQCRFCPRIFLYTAALFRHEQTHADRFSCVGKLSVRKHVVVAETHSDGEDSDKEDSLSCTYCHKKFDNSGRLARHIRQVHNKTNKYKNKIPVNARYSSDTNELLDATKQTDRVNQSIDLQDTQGSLMKRSNGYSPGLGEKCSICRETFQSELILQSHYKSKHRNQSNGIMSCACCEYETKDVRNFVIHGRIHTGEMPYVCAQCGVRYTGPNALGKHIRSIHQGVKTFDRKCSQCGKRFRQIEAYMLHQLTHTDKHPDEHPYVCEECGKGFACRKSLSRHRRFVHDETLKYVCKECDKDYVNSASLKLHNIRYHMNDLPLPYLDTKQDMENTHTQCDDSGSRTTSTLLNLKSEPTEEDSFHCIQCGVTYKSVAELSVHETGHASERVALTRPTTSLIQSIERQTTSVIQAIERQTTPLTQSLEWQTTSVTPSLTSQISVSLFGGIQDIDHDTAVSDCSQYNRSCSVKSEQTGSADNQTLDVHLTEGQQTKIEARTREHKTDHISSTSEKCYICQETFESVAVLRRHYRSKHYDTLNKTFSCIFCNFKANDASKLFHHGLVHTGEKPYVCRICGKRYTRKCEVNLHVRLMHQDGERYNRKCSECGDRFSKRETYELHRRTHKVERPYVCEQCDKSYTCRKALTFHIGHVHGRLFTPLTHSKKLQTTTVTPSLSSQTSVSLIEHENDTTSALCRKCCICHERFESETILQSHYKSNHRDKSNRILSCVSCDYKTNDVRSFAIHGRKHTGERPYGCTQCGEHYISQNTLGKHMKATHQEANNKNKNCSENGEKFKHIEASNPHQRMHNEKRLNVCAQCDKRFTYLKSLTIHIQKVHNTSQTHVCTQCGKGCRDDATLKLHMIGCHGGKGSFTCTVCGEIYSSGILLKQHEARHSGNNLLQNNSRENCEKEIIDHVSVGDCLNTSGMCYICQETFESVAVLRRHYRSKHYDTLNKTFSCIYCTFKVNDASNFFHHGLVHTGEKPYVCRICCKRYTRQREVNQHVRLVHQDGESYNRKCQQCGERFKERETFKLHRRTHKDERPYVCEQCDRTFTSPKALTLHIRHVHDKLFTHVCAQCGAGCTNSSQLKLHMFRRHGSECSCLCTVCGKKYPTKYLLRRHEISHRMDMGGISYKCSQCDKNFLTISARVRHIKTVHVAERPFVCVECGKTFKHKNHLNTHVASHLTDRPFLCVVCGKMFASNTLLRVHAFSHIRRPRKRNAWDVKTVACLHCDNKFYTNFEMTRHTKTVHMGERPFVCIQCGKMFKQKAHLNTHMTSHMRQ